MKRFTYTLKDGTDLTCRPVSVLQLFARGQMPPAFMRSAAALEKNGAEEQESFIADGKAGALYDAVIGAGVISPRIWFGPDAQCPEGQIPVLDLGDDYMALGNAILSGSGQTEEAKAALSFRGSERGDGVAGPLPVPSNGTLALVAPPAAARRIRFYSAAG